MLFSKIKIKLVWYKRSIYSSLYFFMYVCVRINAHINRRRSWEFSVWKENKMLPEQHPNIKESLKLKVTACGVCHRTACCYWKNTFYLAEKWWDEVAIKNSRIVLFTFMAGHVLFFFFFFPMWMHRKCS